ncbi:PREDICTED: uncharacterized protein LOC109587425 [Amphimedon queenslandica]|uniref:Death domain-containing protein n=1 Tax=Amphimedon queenslandica TaxID=400682 RepID=A0AAN0JQA0_AMPQE|nr:PREDICTED: uncharacterized protein LOC109587425 [Amphimedon queenslandica]|eukprot:XP_019859226.1 PREDICTED: uncharacterized protein LOC109587425 [Amphimedon queenslandica]
MRGQFSESCDPLVLSWEDNVIPQGMYPALVVSLLKEEFKMLFKKQIPYRNAIKLQSRDLGVNILLVDTIQWLEIYCAGPVQDACPKLRDFVHRSIQSVSSKFYYSSNTLDGALCLSCGAGVCHPNEAVSYITCTNDECLPREIGPRQSCWFKRSATVSVPCGASANELSSDRSTSKIPVKMSNEVQQSDLIRLFKDSAAHYMLIGTALDVKVDDLLPIPGAATTNLILVFQRWIDSNKEVTWRKVLQVCDDFPNELGKVKADVESFLSSDKAPNKL